MKIDFQKELNSEQYQVVSSGDGPHLVLAGAGSGKTRTLVYRVAWLIDQGIDPSKILLVTFTNKAANEMLERVKKILQREGKSLSIWGGTFHSLANRLLKIYGENIGIKRNFSILDAQDSNSLLKNISKDFFKSMSKGKYPSVAIVKETISFSVNSDLEIKDALEIKFSEWLAFSGQIESIQAEYKKRKKEADFLDFDDLLFYWRKLSQDSDMSKVFSKKWDYVLVDEYQDTNFLQAEIVYNLSRKKKNVIVVGDDAQSIYSFRAADIRNILDFPKLFKGCQVHKLETNYRSTPEIISLANVVIKENQNQFFKNLKSVSKSYLKPELMTLRDNREEARFIARKIGSFLNDSVNPREIAVLFRAAHHSQALEMELNKRNIAYEMRGGLKFFERAHVKDVVAILRIINNFKDEISWQRVLQMYEGIGLVTMKKIFSKIKELEDIEFIFDLNLNLPAKAQQSWHNFLYIFKKILKFNSENDLSKLIKLIVKDYSTYLISQYSDYRQREEDLNQLAIFAVNYNNLDTFLNEVSLQEGFDVQNDRRSNQEKIVLSTIHQAKGLEWKIVFIMYLTNDAFPHPLCTTEEEIEEERRLFYVAITRAKKNLILTYPLSVFRYGESKSLEVSEFIKGLGPTFFEANEFSFQNNSNSRQGNQFSEFDGDRAQLDGEMDHESNFEEGHEYLPSINI
ncbi:ATP-dependent helicase [bacterium]|nr:ATP-dependent helicase [bacterium]